MSNTPQKFQQLWTYLCLISKEANFDSNRSHFLPDNFAELVLTEQLYRSQPHHVYSQTLKLALIIFCGKSGALQLAKKNFEKLNAFSIHEKSLVGIFRELERIFASEDLNFFADEQQILGSGPRSGFGPKGQELLAILKKNGPMKKEQLISELFSQTDDWERSSQKFRALLFRINKTNPGKIVSQAGRIFLA